MKKYHDINELRSEGKGELFIDIWHLVCQFFRRKSAVKYRLTSVPAFLSTECGLKTGLALASSVVDNFFFIQDPKPAGFSSFVSLSTTVFTKPYGGKAHE